MTASAAQPAASALSADSPADLLQRLIEAGGELDRQSRLVLACLDNDDVERSRLLIADRAAAVAALELLHRRFRQCCPEWDAFLTRLAPAERPAAEAAAERFNAVLRTNGEMDRRIAARLEACGAGISRSLGEIRTIRQTQRAYTGGAAGAAAGTHNRFMDRRG